MTGRRERRFGESLSARIREQARAALADSVGWLDDVAKGKVPGASARDRVAAARLLTRYQDSCDRPSLVSICQEADSKAKAEREQ